MYRNIVLIISIMVLGKFVFGQVTTDRFAISPKIGIYGTLAQNTKGGILIGGEINTNFNKIAFSMDYYRFEEVNIFGESPNENYNQMGFMIGKNHGNDGSIFSMQLLGGLAPIWGKERTNFLRSTNDFISQDLYETERFMAIGLALKMGCKLTPTDVFGIGLDLQANINHKRPVFSIMLSFEIGDL